MGEGADSGIGPSRLSLSCTPERLAVHGEAHDRRLNLFSAVCIGIADMLQVILQSCSASTYRPQLSLGVLVLSMALHEGTAPAMHNA